MNGHLRLLCISLSLSDQSLCIPLSSPGLLPGRALHGRQVRSSIHPSPEIAPPPLLSIPLHLSRPTVVSFDLRPPPPPSALRPPPWTIKVNRTINWNYISLSA